MTLDGKLGKVAGPSDGPPRDGPLAGTPAAQNDPSRATPDILKTAFGGGGVSIGGTTGTNSIFQNYDHLDKQQVSTNPLDTPKPIETKPTRSNDDSL